MTFETKFLRSNNSKVEVDLAKAQGLSNCHGLFTRQWNPTMTRER